MEIFTSTKTTVIICYEILLNGMLIKITLIFDLTKFFKLRNNQLTAKRIEYKCKTAILLYCFHTAGVLTYLCYITFWALEHHFIENLKSMLKENQIMK